jgi:cytochrome c oxidase subunit IV
VTTSNEFRVAIVVILGAIILGAGLLEIVGVVFYHDVIIKPALIPLLILPPLAALALIVYLIAGRRKS